MPDETDPDIEGESPFDFEWDERKNETNIQKHGIDFFRARLVFRDPAAVMMESPNKSSEQRYLIIGQLDAVLATIVYTVRDGRIRIISARRARRSERQRYGQ
jgi:uncharacterized DUF497 family protein